MDEEAREVAQGHAAITGTEAGFDPKCLTPEPGHKTTAPFGPGRHPPCIRPVTGDGHPKRGEIRSPLPRS